MYIPRPAKLLFTVYDGWNNYLGKHGNPSCSRKIFAESSEPFAGPRQQASQPLQKLQHQLGLIADGEAGRRAATAAGLRTSADTLIRRVITTPEARQPCTPHIGIDEWGHRYGTLIVNLDTHRSLVLLPGRDRRALASWLGFYAGTAEISVIEQVAIAGRHEGHVKPSELPLL